MIGRLHGIPLAAMIETRLTHGSLNGLELAVQRNRRRSLWRGSQIGAIFFGEPSRVSGRVMTDRHPAAYAARLANHRTQKRAKPRRAWANAGQGLRGVS